MRKLFFQITELNYFPANAMVGLEGGPMPVERSISPRLPANLDSPGDYPTRENSQDSNIEPDILSMKHPMNSKSENPSDSESLSDLFEAWQAPGKEKDSKGSSPDMHSDETIVSGRAGARSRDRFISEQNRKAFEIARKAPLQHYDKDVYRAVATKNRRTYNDFTYSDPGRYNRPGESALYNSESFNDVVIESKNYQGLKDKTVVRSRFSGNIVDATQLKGITTKALSEPFGQDGKHKTILSRLTGEDPYFHTRAISDAVRQQGAEGVRVPGNGGATHLNIFPENVADMKTSYRYLDQEEIQLSGNAIGPRQVDPGVALAPAGSTANRNGHNPQVIKKDMKLHGRKGAAAYGAVGAATISTLESLKDGQISADEVKQIGANAAMGGANSLVDDMLTRKLGGGMKGALRSGMLLDGAVSAATSLWENADTFEQGQMSAGAATADVVVDTGVGISAGLAGMAAGAIGGSVVPVVGTAVGAVIGFAGGMLASWATSSALEGSGLAGWAKEGLGTYLDSNFEKPLSEAWHLVAGAKNVIQDDMQSIGSAIEAINAQAERVNDLIGGTFE